MLIEIGGIGLCIALIPGNKRIALDKIRSIFPEKKVSIIHSSKVEQTIGLKIGAITSLIKLENQWINILVDNELVKHDLINISSGNLQIGITISVKDLVKITNAKVMTLSGS